MSFTRISAVVLALVIVACSGDNPLGTGTVTGERPDGLTDRIAPAPKSVPFHATEQNTIEVVPPFLCLPPDFPDVCGEFNPILHAVFPGTIEGTHIGAGTIYSTSEVNFSVFPFAQISWSVITSEDGDDLYVELVGIAFPGPGPGDVIFSGDFEFTGGTGRFSTASGTGTYAGTANEIAAVGQFEMIGRISK